MSNNTGGAATPTAAEETNPAQQPTSAPAAEPSSEPAAEVPTTSDAAAAEPTTSAAAPEEPTSQEATQPAAPTTSSAPAAEPSTEATSEAAAPTEPTTSAAPAAPESSSSSSVAEPAQPTTTAPAAEPTTAEDPATSAAQPTTSEAAADPTTSEDAAASESEVPLTTVVTVSPSDGTEPRTSVVVYIATATEESESASSTVSASGTSTAAANGASGSSDSGGGGGGLNQKGKVAIGVVVPIAAIAILALVGLFWWKKRRARMQAEEERRKEVEDYGYNPNADPTIPAVGMGANDGAYEMREDGSAGYRGWGTTVAGSSGRKASTTMSGGVAGQAYSDVTSPTRANVSDTRSGEPLMDGHGAYSPEGEILGAMGPSAANNRGGDVHRGPSNASSSYSAAARSDGSDSMGIPYGAGGTYYDQYAENPYGEGYGSRPPEMGGQAVIRDNPARRNMRIENPSHYPQQSAGISQNF